jgi:hypothetical protein
MSSKGTLRVIYLLEKYFNFKVVNYEYDNFQNLLIELEVDFYGEDFELLNKLLIEFINFELIRSTLDIFYQKLIHHLKSINYNKLSLSVDMFTELNTTIIL